jgi:DNA-binding NarL/FixJ family response regulator
MQEEATRTCDDDDQPLNGQVPSCVFGQNETVRRRIRVLLVDDHSLVRESLRVLLETDPEFVVVAEASTLEAALAAVESTKPDVAITDLELSSQSGIEFPKMLKACKSRTKVLVLTCHATLEYVSAALRAGALGYVLKDDGYGELAKGLRAVHAGNLYVTVHASPEPLVMPKLVISKREREILVHIALGVTNKVIARTLQISVKTVEKHRNNLAQKLDLHGAAAFTLFAVRHGLVRCYDDSSSSPADARELAREPWGMNGARITG